MKKKIISILSVCALATAGIAFVSVQPTGVMAEANTVYVSSNGSDTGAGTSASPYATLDKALTEIADGGTITLKDAVSLDGWTAHGKSVTITGGALNASGLTEVEINDSVTFTNMSWTVDAGAFVYANGYKTTIGEGVSWSNEIKLFGGAKKDTTIASTDLTVLSGTYTHIYGGSYQGTVTGNTNLTVGGTVNNSSAVDTAIKNHTGNYYIFGGGHSSNKVQGSTNLLIKDSAKAVYVFGGSHGWAAQTSIAKGTNVTVLGGTMMGVYGGSQGANSGSGANVRIEGGNMQQVFGGSEGFPLTGNVDLRLLGGTITRRIYGGCYNDDTEYYVSGKINLELGGNVSIPLNASHNDKGIYARSRYNGDVEDCQIVFTSEAAYEAYKNKLGGSDWGATYVMGSTTAADEYHYYAYTQSENIIMQTCAYHNTLAATARLSLDESVSLRYTGSEIKPVTVEVSADWEYAKPTLVYENNVEIGSANYSLTAGQICVEGGFIIVDTPAILGGSVRTSAPSGLRFQSKIAAELVDTGAKFGTLIIPKEVLGNNELTVDTPTVNNIVQTKWATESIKANKPEVYEEGYEYFNAVLTEIPEEYYDEVIVARSYVYANGQYYYAEAIERSVAQVAAYAIKDGYVNKILYDYVDKALADSTVSMESAVEIYAGETHQLLLTGNKGYVAIWSSNSDILSVDENGKITSGKTEGTAVVTAQLGNITVECIVTVKHRWTGYY